MTEDTEASPADGADPSIRSLVPTVYLPGLLLAVGLGAVVPQVALAARDIGASVAVAGVVVALRSLGTMLFDVPSGLIVARLGNRNAMLASTALLVVALVGCATSGSVWVLGAWVFVVGCGWSIWLLARQTYVSEVMPSHRRGRALSTMGGAQRIGMFIGPFVGAAAVALYGFDGVFYVHLVLALAAGGAVVFYHEQDSGSGSPRVQPQPHQGLRGIGGRHASVFLTGGIGVMALGALREARQVVLPLWAETLGFDAVVVGVIFGISSAADMVLFYPAGSMSDRFGRKFVAVPSMVLLSVGLMLLPLSQSLWSLVAVGLLLGLGNGVGSGLVMTLGADFSPPGERAAFLGVWNFLSHVGSTSGPLLASGIAAVSLAAAPVSVGAIGLAGAVLVLAKMPEPRRLHEARI